MYNVLRPILNKGGAGRSSTRQETVDALIPLVAHHGDLLALYDRALRDLSDRRVATSVEAVMNRHRNELAKLKETVLASGGVPPTGVGLNRLPERLGDSDGEMLHALADAEREYRDALREVLDYPHHQIRTRAILNNNITGSTERLGALNPLIARAPRKATPPPPIPEDDVTGTPSDLPHTVQTADPMDQPMHQRKDHIDADPTPTASKTTNG